MASITRNVENFEIFEVGDWGWSEYPIDITVKDPESGGNIYVQINVDEAKALIAALNETIVTVEKNK
jgi:hypothetical protein